MVPSDQMHIESIRSALWSREGTVGRASVMVGAGMSLNSVPNTPSAPPFMMWGELAMRMLQRLGYSPSTPTGVSDSLRLAQEYESAFPNALEELVREAVPDLAHGPGPLHKLLLSLPWLDVFTTNYDTLLERTRPAVPDVRYDVVVRIDDIATASRPRIVKLHGTLPSHRPFILTEEHFRQYPRRFAPFVNLVQQSIMESTLCLIGFSGDDPNFLQWSGWVRDNLGEIAPPIYLCGVLDLTPAREYILRSRRVIPIDLGRRFPSAQYPLASVRNARALEWFLLSLHNGAPEDVRDWPTPPPLRSLPRSPALPEPLPAATTINRRPRHELAVPRGEFAPGLLTRLIRAWFDDRQWYPGWLITPEMSRYHLWHDSLSWVADYTSPHLLQALAARNPAEELLGLRELCWRLDRAMHPPTGPMTEAIRRALSRIAPFGATSATTEVLTPDRPLTASDDWGNGPRVSWENVADAYVELSFVLLRDAREEFNDERFQQQVSSLAQISELRPQWRSRWFSEQVAWHVMRLEQTEARRVLSTWPTDQAGPFWRAKRAAFIAEVGDFNEAQREVDAALREVQAANGGVVTPSYRTRSEEGAVVFLAELVRQAEDTFRDVSPEWRRRLDRLDFFHCDPREELGERQRKLIEQQREAEAEALDEGDIQFDPGYQSRGNRYRYIEPYAWALWRTFDEGAIPIKTRNLQVFPKAVGAAAEEMFQHNPLLATSMLIRCSGEKTLAQLFDRVAVATAPRQILDRLYTIMASAVREALSVLPSGDDPDYGFADRILGECLRAISRIVVPMSESSLEDAFNLAVAAYESTGARRRGRRFDVPLGHLFRRLFYSAASQQLARWVTRLLVLPIVGAPGFEQLDVGTWPEPFSEIPDDVRLPPGDRTRWQSAIERLIVTAKEIPGDRRQRAIRRLGTLHRAGGLSEDQQRAFTDALWAHTVGGIPSETGHLVHYCAMLPSTPTIDVAARLREWLLTADLPPLFDTDRTAGFSTGAVAAANEHISAWMGLTASVFGSGPQTRLLLSIDEARTLLSKCERWVSDQLVDAFRRRPDSTEDVVDPLARFLAQNLAPVLDSDGRRRVFAIFASLGMSTPPLYVAPLELLTDGAQSPEVADRIIRGLHAVGEGAENNTRWAVHGLFLWVVYRRATLCGDPPPELFDEVLNILVARKQPGLSDAIRTAETVASDYPEILSARNIAFLLRALEYLMRDTALPQGQTMSRRERARLRHRPQLRSDASKLAAALFQYFQKRNEPIPDIVSQWRQSAEQDALPEVRREWEELR